MSGPKPFSRQVRFGEFQLDLETAELHTNGQKFTLQGQPFQVLAILIERPGELVSREELRNRLWPSDTFVDFDHGVNKAVNRLREALGDSAEYPQFVETVPRRGYRFIAPMQMGCDAAKQELSPPHLAAAPWDAKHLAALLGTAMLIVVVLGFATRTRRSHTGTFDLQDVRMTKLTESGAAVNVAISPDGRYVAYAQQDGEKEALRLRQLATHSDLQILPPENGSLPGLTFSPDGNYIYFVRSDKSDPDFHSLYMMPVLGGPARQVMREVDSAISFSPDTRQFVFTRGDPLHNSVEVRIANADGRGERLLATMHDRVADLQYGPTWSPDGRTIALSVVLWGKQLRALLDTVSVSDGTVRELYSSPDPIGRPVWLRGGNELLVPMNDRINQNLSQLWAVSYPQGKARQLTKELVDHDLRISTTSDSKTVAAIAVTQVSNVWVARAAYLQKARQITSDDLAMLGIAETRDGKLLVTSDNGKLWIMKADGSNRTFFASARSAPSPCGQFVVFLDDTGAMTLMRVNADGSNPTPLTTGGDVFTATCSPDGKLIFYASLMHPQKIWRIPVEGGAPVEIATVGGDGIVGRISISPDGKLVAYLYRQFADTLRSEWNVDVIPIGGGPAEKTLKVPVGIRSLCWAPDGRGLQFLLTLNGATNVWEQWLAGGQPKPLTRFTSGQIFDFNWSPDHSRLLMLHGTISSDVVLLSNFR